MAELRKNEFENTAGEQECVLRGLGIVTLALEEPTSYHLPFSLPAPPKYAISIT